MTHKGLWTALSTTDIRNTLTVAGKHWWMRVSFLAVSLGPLKVQEHRSEGRGSPEKRSVQASNWSGYGAHEVPLERLNNQLFILIQTTQHRINPAKTMLLWKLRRKNWVIKRPFWWRGRLLIIAKAKGWKSKKKLWKIQQFNSINIKEQK